MRTIAFFFFLTLAALAQPAPSVRLEPDQQAWLQQIPDSARACTGMPSPNELVSVKQPTTLLVHFVQGSIKTAAVMGSSGNPDLDRRVSDCYRNLPPEPFTAAPIERLMLAVFYWKPASSKPVWIAAPAFMGMSNCARDYYPSNAIRLAETGKTELRFNIAADGSVKDLAVATSSGYDDLDSAAVACASQWHYRPATQDGVAVEVPWRTIIQWKINPPHSDMDDIFQAGVKCAKTPAPDGDDLRHVSVPTAVGLQFSGGAIVNVSVKQSSGSPTLDARAVSCFAAISPDLSKKIVGAQSIVFPVWWK